MVLKSFLIRLLFALVLNPLNLPAQDSGCTRHTVAVGVVDRDWNLVRGLGAANFHGKVRGSDVQILSTSIDTSPRRIVLLLDASGSMMGEGCETAKVVAEYLIRLAPPQASLAQMGFSGTVRYTADFYQDRSELMKTLADLLKLCGAPRGRTALFDAISSGLTTVGSLGVGDVIYAVTDGGDNASRTDPGKVEKALLTEGVRLFAVVTSSETPTNRRSSEVTEGVNRLRSMVEATGGNMLTLQYGSVVQGSHIKAHTYEEALNLALQRMYQQMGEFYRVEVSLPEQFEKPTKWKLEVVDANGRPMRGVEVHYPQELMPCANASP